ncbi:hypothetical protein K435DRAFT_854263 [Dendrothele bispora CBS 962.96]|uniref:Uncharacterized protein n=1 Tax=Dendrothele bispora (strain CBS 962.96) TaxID=1314807 RepID=A0A4S8MF20_DENBC|nr:hypothetical protein K435DRAFT_854263 [Dendrothele bispora CBS 962.96]
MRCHALMPPGLRLVTVPSRLDPSPQGSLSNIEVSTLSELGAGIFDVRRTGEEFEGPATRNFDTMPTSAPITLQLFPAWKLERSPDVLELRFPPSSPPTDASNGLERLPRDEGSTPSLRELLAGYRERCDAQDRQLILLRQQLNGAISLQDRLGQRISELSSFALLAYRGNPIQVFPNLYELLDGIFTRTYETAIRVHNGEKDPALESLESLLTRLETLQSFVRRAEATSRRFVGDESGRSPNERFLLSNIPPQVKLPEFSTILDRTRLPFPEPRHTFPRSSFTPPNTLVGTDSYSLKRSREEELEDGEIPSKRRC